MVWKSREDKLPPSSFFSNLIPYLQRAYPGAQISREVMQALRPYFVEAWRNGKTAEAAAQTICSCNGREIVPSPVVGIHIAKGSARPPKGAQRGDVFGADELRPPARIERLQRQLTRVSREQAQQKEVETKWEHRARTARKEATQQEAVRRKGAASSRYGELLAEAQQIQAEIRRVEHELNRLGRSEAPPPPPPPSEKPVIDPSTRPPTGTPSEKKPPAGESPAGRPVPRGKRAKKEPGTNGQTGKPTEAEQQSAMMSAIKGLLPDIAGQLSAQMAKDEASKK